MAETVDPLSEMFTLFAAPIAGTIRSVEQFRKGVDEFLRGVENFNRTMENLRRVLRDKGPSQIQFWFIALAIGIVPESDRH